jgi:hypothetical protein
VPLAALAAIALLLTAGCRIERLWSGIQVQLDGRVKLASEQPRCGCLAVSNTTDSVLRLQSIQGGQLLGEATLKPKEISSFRFDWAGTSANAFYLVSVFSPDGRSLDARKTLSIDTHPVWTFCDEALCEYGSLMMNLGDHGR